MKIASFLLLTLACVVGPACQSTRAPVPAPVAASPERFEQHVAWLADDARGGRGTGSEGLEAAARYVAAEFEAAGLVPLGDDGYLQHFEATGSRALGEGNALAIGTTQLELGTDWIPFASTATSQAQGVLVFAGYGIRDPEGGYDDYEGLDVEGKVVVVLRGGPGSTLRVGRHEDDDAEHPGDRYLDRAGAGRRMIDFTTKINTAFKAGAVGILVVNDPATYPPGSEQDVTMTYGSTRSGGVSASLPAVHMTAGAAEGVLTPLGLDLAILQDLIDFSMAPASLDTGVRAESPTWTVSVSVVAEREQVATFNVVGLLPGMDPNEVVVVGAHMDHLGDGLSSGSLAGAEGRGKIHNGADDNASGTAGLMELARLLSDMNTTLRRGVVFVAFGAEEWGLLGSEFFVENPPAPLQLEHITAMVNMDMIGRSKDGYLSVEGLGTSPGFDVLVTSAHERIGAPFAKLAVSDEVPPNSDQAPFDDADIPILSLFTGLHDDYHRPSDDTPLIDPVAGARIASLAGEFVVALAQLPERPVYTDPEVAKQALAAAAAAPAADPHAAAGDATGTAPAAPARGYSVWFGSQPDMTYTADDGLRVTGTTPDSPAQKCGLLGGDVIVSLNGQTVRNIQDYAVLLFSHQPGDTITVGVRRDGEILELKATLETKGGDS